MEAARAEEGEPPAGPFTLDIRTLTGGTTTLRDVVSSQTVGSVTLRLCAETGEEPTLTRLLHEQKPLADRKRSLKQYGIVRAAELHVTPMRPSTALPISLGIGATSRLLAALAACGTAEVLKLRKAERDAEVEAARKERQEQERKAIEMEQETQMQGSVPRLSMDEMNPGAAHGSPAMPWKRLRRSGRAGRSHKPRRAAEGSAGGRPG